MLQIAPPRTEAPVQGIEIPTSAAGMGGIREVVAFIRRAQRIVALFAGVALRGGFQNWRARRLATRKMHALCSSDWMMNPSRS